MPERDTKGHFIPQPESKSEPAAAHLELTDDERVELERYRARKAAAANPSNHDRLPDGKPYWTAFTVEEQIKDHYLYARGTIQDYARIYKLSVPEVLAILGMSEMGQVETLGDLIDQTEAGPNIELKGRGTTADVPFSTN